MIVVSYFNSFMIACKNFKCKLSSLNEADSIRPFIEALRTDLEALQIQFSNFVLPARLQESLVPFRYMREFLTSEPQQLVEICGHLRHAFGQIFTEKSIKILLKVRLDITKENKFAIQEECISNLIEYNLMHPEDEEKISILFQELDEEEEITLNDGITPLQSNRKTFSQLKRAKTVAAVREKA
jgi:hypothetical protein